MHRKSLLIAACLLAGGANASDDRQVPYPDGYRSWHHVKTMLIAPGHALENPFQGIHHVYANEGARDGLDSGSYEDGSVLVFDLLAYGEDGHAIVEGERKLVGVMQKDAGKYMATGGWGFEGFAGSSTTDRLVSDGGVSCYACHTQVEDVDYVFSRDRE